MPFTVDDVLKRVSDIKIHKSSGFPLVASRIWKIVFNSYAPILCHIFNCSLVTGCFPEKWKMGTVIPILKVLNPSQTGELRPISLLPLPSKIIEHLIHAQMTHFIEHNNILSKFQNGFRHNRSTIQTIF